jgi:hypothetical protein
MARRVLISTLLLLVSLVLVARSLVAASSLRTDSPFVALAAGHVGQPYVDGTSDIFVGAYPQARLPFTSYQVTQGTLPAGLQLDPTTGVVSGTPRVARAEVVRLGVTDAGGAPYAVRAEVCVLSRNESEVVPAQSFTAPGPYSVTQRNTTPTWVSSYDGKTYSARVMIFQPQGTTGKLPFLCHHRGRGFTHDNYVQLLTHIASYGFVCASISDSQSFYDPSDTSQLDSTYDAGSSGMENASASQEGLMDYLLGLSSTPGDPLYGVLDNENAFVSGHSRGGGATQASHTRSLPLRLRGVIYFMAFDLRYFSDTVAPTTAPIYAIPSRAERLPSLIISAENDHDLSYPFADEFIDRATGPTTFVTLYGATHQDMTDSELDDGPSSLGRTLEQNEVANLVVAFMRRWSAQDTSLESFLYGRDNAASRSYGVASWRRTSPALLVDDFQDADPSHNLLGGANGATGMTRTEASAYPSFGDLGSLGIQHSICQFQSSSSTFDLDLAGSRDLRRSRALLARVQQTGSNGWNVDGWVVLTDAHGNTASVQFSKLDGSSTGFLPPFVGGTGQSQLNRFLSLDVPLYLFERATPALDLRKITKVSFTFGATVGVSPEVALDDVRFE